MRDQLVRGLPIDLNKMTVTVDGRTVRARHYPISIDVAALRKLAASDEVQSRVEELSQSLAHNECQLILRVDRTDPSKNIVRGFLAFGLMLEDHPELAGKVRFLALLQPSRLDVPEYSAYLASIGAEVARINARYDHLDYEPIDLRLVQDLPLAVAAYSVCDVLLVNAVADGMNLVAKEAAVVNQRDGVLVLSENTGAHQELGEHAVTVYPCDIRQQADALYEAISMTQEDQQARLRAAAQVIERNGIGTWFSSPLAPGWGGVVPSRGPSGGRWA